MWQIEWIHYLRCPSKANCVLSCFLLNCTAVCSEVKKKHAFGQPPHRWSSLPHLHLKPSYVPYSKLFFSLLSLSPLHNNAPFALFWLSRVDGWGGGGSDKFYHCSSMLSACLWMWTGTISGFSEVHIGTSQITTALISAKNDAKKTFFGGNKFSTLDLSCFCPLYSMGSYFGETWVLLSNLLSRLQMKVSGWATKKSFCRHFGVARLLTSLRKSIFFSIKTSQVWGSEVSLFVAFYSIWKIGLMYSQSN